MVNFFSFVSGSEQLASQVAINLEGCFGIDILSWYKIRNGIAMCTGNPVLVGLLVNNKNFKQLNILSSMNCKS